MRKGAAANQVQTGCEFSKRERERERWIKRLT